MKYSIRLSVIFLFSFTTILNTLSLTTPDRVEPAFWWVGMNNKNLQLLVKGNNISDLNPELDYKGVSIEKVTKVKSPNYLFIDLHISENTVSGKFEIKFKKDKTTEYSYEYELLQRDKETSNIEGFNPSDVMYLITPDRFVNGNPANDNNDNLIEKANREDKGGRHGGDIQGILNSLDYIKDMGFTAIWVNPVLENNMTGHSYHGYATTDFYKVDERFGTNEEYRNLSLKAQKKGVKFIMDMIVNHCGSKHWWMNDLPTEDWLNFQSDYENSLSKLDFTRENRPDWEEIQKYYHLTNHTHEAVQDPYASDYDRQLQTDGWFSPFMPDLNHHNELLATYLIQNSIWWVEYLHLSGIRMDTYAYADMDFMSDWTCSLMTEYPNLNIVGEEWTTNQNIVSYWQRDKLNQNGYTSCLPSLMDFPLQSALIETLTQEDSNSSEGVMNLYRTLANDFIYSDPGQLVVFPDNHDMSRFFTQVNHDYDLFKMGLSYIAVTRGIPQIFYGTEILMKNPGTQDHGIIRSDFPGGWEGDTKNAFTGVGLSDQEKEAQEFVKTLLNWRKNCEVIHNGNLKHFSPGWWANYYTLFRYNEKEIVMLIINNSHMTNKIDLTKYKAELLGESKEGINVLTGEKVSFESGEIEVAGKTALILEIKK